jgi:predicted dehydrogenase
MFPALHERGLTELQEREGVTAYADYEDLLDDPNVDAVALTVRCKEQGAMAAQALEAGKHVNSEVPAAHRMEDCWRIVVAAERSGLVYQLAEQGRYAGFFLAWRDMVRDGRLGHVTYCEGEYVSYKGTLRYYQDWTTGEFVYPEDLADHPDARPTWIHEMDPIHYLPHELSPILMVLDDRVVRVTAMGARKPSYAHPELNRSDIQVALMQTEKDTILRMMQGGTQPLPPNRDHHHYQMIGTRGCVESGRSYGDRHKMWFADSQMHDTADVDWSRKRADASPEALESGHDGTDYYVHTAFRDAVLGKSELEFDVYRAMDTAAPAILAADSIENGSVPIDVPDIRQIQSRPSGQMP